MTVETPAMTDRQIAEANVTAARAEVARLKSIGAPGYMVVDATRSLDAARAHLRTVR
jgi:hypothetical protein